jgi:antitoxin CptB
MWFLEAHMKCDKKLTDEEMRRMSWRCRRGLLELDIVLQRFSDKHLAGLSKQEMLAFDSLLDLPDNEFLDVVTTRIKVVDVDTLKEKQIDLDAMQTIISKLSSHYDN